MADEVTTTAPVVTATPAPDGQVTPQTVATPAGSDEPAQPSKREWADFHRTQRQILEQLKANATPKQEAPPVAKGTEVTPPAANGAMSEVAVLRREMAVKDACLEHGITDARQRRLIDLAIKAENPPDVAAFVAEHAASLKPATTAAPTTTDPPKTPTVNTGAPGTTQPILDADPNRIDPAVFAGLPKEEQRKRLDAWLGSGNRKNPYRSGARHTR